MFGDNGYETSTLWNYKVIGRYTMPFDIGFSGSWKVQSGGNWGRSISVRLPGRRRTGPCASSRSPPTAANGPDPRRPVRQGSASAVRRGHGDVDVFNLTERRDGDDLPERHRRDFKEVIGPARPADRAVRAAVRLLVRFGSPPGVAGTIPRLPIPAIPPVRLLSHPSGSTIPPICLSVSPFLSSVDTRIWRVEPGRGATLAGLALVLR